MQYRNNNVTYFPPGAIACAKIVRDYASGQKPFPEGAIEAVRVLREFSARKQQTIEKLAS